MYFNKETYTNDMEILYSDANLVPFSGTVLASNVTVADEHGRKYVLAGSLIDPTGAIITETGEVGAEKLSATPVGILYKTIDVTNGDMPCSLIVEGYLREDRILEAFPNTTDEIKIALPKITFK